MLYRLVILLVSVGMLTLPACATPVTYSAEAIAARIVDVETKQPVEGVVVVAHWVLEGGIHVDRVGDLIVLETVTDDDGRFYFPPWGPIRHWKRSRLTNMDPEILIFKSGYEYRRLANPSTKEAIEGKPYPVRHSIWNGKTIEMKHFVDRPLFIGPYKYKTSAYAQNLSLLSISLDSIAMSDCNWRKIPRMLLALKAQRDLFRQQHIGFSLIGADNVPTDVEKCGRPEDFFKNYKP